MDDDETEVARSVAYCIANIMIRGILPSPSIEEAQVMRSKSTPLSLCVPSPSCMEGVLSRVDVHSLGEVEACTEEHDR